MRFCFDATAATHAAAYLLRELGGKDTRFHVLKLMYLADRSSIERHRHPIVGGTYVSMQHGPVPSEVYNLIKGVGPADDQAEWSSHIRNMEADETYCELLREPAVSHLSKADTQILGFVAKRFGAMSFSRLWDYVHALPEWQDPGNSSLPIEPDRLLEILGVAQEERETIAEDEAAQEIYAQALKKAKTQRTSS